MARDLLGATLLVTETDGAVTSGLIVETEAYTGTDDPASHAGRGRTPRSEIMYGPPGVAYIYLIYGVHHCFNVVSEPAQTPGAVLIRALEPLTNLPLMATRRHLDPTSYSPLNLCSGPGKLSQALALTTSSNAASLQSSAIKIYPATTQLPHTTTPRRGITKAVDRPWRFALTNNPFTS